MRYKISDLFNLQMGKTPDRHNKVYWDSATEQWISIGDLGRCGKYISDTKECISQRAIEETGIKIIPKNTVIMSFKLSIGKVAITGKDIYSNEAIMAFLDKGVIKLNTDYIYYLLMAKDWDIGTNKAVMGKTLNKATLSNMEIEVHEYEEQIEIVSVLDEIVRLLDGIKYVYNELDTLIKSRFVEMFGDPVSNTMGWEMQSWESVFETRTGKLDSNAAVDGGQYPFFTCAKEWLWIDNYAYDCEALLLAGNNAAGIYDVKHYKGKFNAYQRTYILQLINDEWSYTLFKYQLEDRLQYLQSQSKGTNTRYLTMGILNSLSFIIPPVELQENFAAFVAQVDKLKVACL